MEIIKEFIPYEQALALKELGFDESCFCIYNREKVLRFNNLNNPNDRNRGVKLTANNGRYPAPLYQQAFRWFREKYGLYGIPEERALLNNFSYQVKSNRKGAITFIVYGGYPLNFKSYEEAELECLKKLIEIIKNP